MPSTDTLKKISAVSGLVFGTFLVLHLLCHYSLYLSGWDGAERMLQRVRLYYQHPLIEPALMMALLIHMGSNTMLYLRRSKMAASGKSKKSGRTAQPAVSSELQMHRYAGYFLSLAIFGHVAATRVVPLLVFSDGKVVAEDGTVVTPSTYDYSFLTAVNDCVPFNLFAVYLIIFGICGGWHLIYGTMSALYILLGKSVQSKPFPFGAKLVARATHILLLNAVLALIGYYYPVDTLAKADLHRKYFDFMGMH